MPPRNQLDLEAADPATIYAAIASMSEDEFTELMADSRKRTLIIGALVEHMAGLFRPEAAGELEAVIHVKLWDRPGGGYDHFELVIAGGECLISTAPEREADLTLKTRPEDLRAIVTGKSGPRRLALKGRLRVLGDLRLGTRLPELFSFG